MQIIRLFVNECLVIVSPTESPTMMKASLNEAEGSLKVPPASTLSFRYRSKLTGRDTVAKISAGREQNEFVALFEEDDVDFRIAMRNSLEGRSACFKMTILDKSYGFVIRSRKEGEIETLVSNGRKLHFIKQSGEQGKKLVSTTATNYGLSRRDASVMLSEIKFLVSYSERKKYSISARIDNGKTVRVLKVNGSNTVADMIRIVSENVYAVKSVHFKGLHLDDETKTMEDLGIHEHSLVDIIGQTHAYNVTILPGKKITVAMSFFATVAQLKTEMTTQEGIPADMQRLFCSGGHEMRDNCTLFEYRRWDSTGTIVIFTNSNNDATGPLDGLQNTKTHKCSGLKMFTVNVTHPNGQLVPVSVCALDTVQDLICKVQAVADIDNDNDNIQCYKNEKRLEKFLPVTIYELDEKFPLRLIIMCTKEQHVCTRRQTSIFIRTLTGKTISIPYCGIMSIQDVKQKIKERQESSDGEYRLLFAGRLLEDNSILIDCGIQRLSTLHMMIKLRGGGGCECKNEEMDKQRRSELMFSERGAISFGAESEQQFQQTTFFADESIRVEPFVIELRLAAVPFLA